MPSVCVKCDDCGAEMSVDTKFKSQARAVSRRHGWTGPVEEAGQLADPNTEDWCPQCSANRPQPKPKPNRCYGCNRVEAPPGDTAPFYCGGCAEFDEYSMAGADDDEGNDE